MRNLPLILALLLTVILVQAVSFTSSPSINSGTNATTTETLECDWTSVDTSQTNVTWYRNGAHFINFTGETSPSTIGLGNTTKGEVWNCSVTIANATNTVTEWDDISIVNSNPNPLQLLNETLSDIGNTTTILEDVPRTFNVTTTDPDGDELSFSDLGSPQNSNLNSATGIFQWTPNSSQIGNTTITFIALDNNTPDKGSSAKDIIFTVLEVNDAPYFSPALVNQTATEGVAFTYNISVNDEESDFPINFSINSTAPNLIINITGTRNATITFTGGSPLFADMGNHTVYVTINDTRNGSTTNSFNIEVSTVNFPPNLSLIPNATGTQGVPFLLIVNATDREVNDTLSFNIAAINCPVTDPWNITKLDQVTQGNVTFANASINQTLTNDHVICSQVNVTVTDSKEPTWQVVNFNITNVNDAPTMYENSSNSNNTDENNITNQTGYNNAIYRYVVNASDPDQLTPGGEVLSFSDNATFFNINSSTGVIEFIPGVSDIGNHTINITVSDDEGLSFTRIMNLEIRNNSAPIITTAGNLSCAEDVLCTIFIDATDADGDNISFVSNDTSIFNISQFNTTSGVLNFTYNQSYVGNYTITVTATDIRGATDNLSFTFFINNTNDVPVLDVVIFPYPIVATHLVNVLVTATDQDIQLFGGNELLNYSNTFITAQSLFNISTSFNNATNVSTGVILFTPNISEVGNHSVNISVSDPQGAIDWQVVNFTVYNDTEPPNITAIYPYGTPVSNTTVFAFRNTTDFPNRTTTVNVSENTSVLFNHTSIDDETAFVNLTYKWVYNGTTVSTNHDYTKSFDFFSSGTYNLTLTVADDRLDNSTWSWIVNVADVNREPLILNPLENVSIGSTETFSGYLELRSNVKFIDPDDDFNGNSTLDPGETNRLSFTYTPCSVANLTITGSDVKFTPSLVGTCLMTFNATDSSGASVQSNTVLVNVTEVPNGTQTTTTVVVSSGGGGGGGGGSANSIIPRKIEVENPEPLNIIAPSEVTIYRDRSIIIPVFLENTWNETLEGVSLGAYTNVSGVEIELDTEYFSEIPVGGKERAQMKVSGYRLGDNFEVLINATVINPDFKDTALVLFNSIEEAEGEEQVRVLVTFAKDLLASNKECQELGELLNRADGESEKGNYKEAAELLDTVINGCKYLVSKTQIHTEQPKFLNFNFIKRFNWFYLGAGVLLALLISAIAVIETRIRREREVEE